MRLATRTRRALRGDASSASTIRRRRSRSCRRRIDQPLGACQGSDVGSRALRLVKSCSGAGAPTDGRSLQAVPDKDGFSTVIDDEHLPDGIYDLRARAVDLAGNERSTDRLADGRRAALALPLRIKTRLRGREAEAGPGERRARQASLSHCARREAAKPLRTDHSCCGAASQVLAETRSSGATSKCSSRRSCRQRRGGRSRRFAPARPGASRSRRFAARVGPSDSVLTEQTRFGAGPPK